jgi:hypothetical protein
MFILPICGTRIERQIKRRERGEKPAGHAFHTNSLTLAMVASLSKVIVLLLPEPRRKVREMVSIRSRAMYDFHPFPR